MDYKSIRNIVMQENDADANTVGEYLAKLLQTLWVEGESFSGKRPFGNSGWEYEIYKALVTAKVVKGEIDEYGDLLDADTRSADKIILDTIIESLK